MSGQELIHPVVMVGVSGTSGSPAALRWAAAEAARLGGSLLAVRAWRPSSPPSATAGRPPSVGYSPDQQRQDAEQRLEAGVLDVLGDDVDVRCELRVGGKLSVLRKASREADLLVLDAPRRTDLTTAPMLAHRLIYQAACPVVIMPPALANQPDSAIVSAGKKLGRGVAESAARAGRPGVRPPSSASRPSEDEDSKGSE